MGPFYSADSEAYELVTTAADGAPPPPRRPLEARCRHYVLVELSGSCAEHDTQKLEAWLEGLMASGVVVDGTIAQDAAQDRKSVV